MNLEQTLLFFFSGLGVFNGALLCIYFLFFAKPKKASNYFLGALLAFLSIRIGKSLFFYFNPELSKIFLQIGLSACFLLGPFLFLYCKAMRSGNRRISNIDYVHISILFLVILLFGIAYPYSENIELWYKNTRIIYYQWFCYIVATSFYLVNPFKKMFSRKQKLDYDEIWSLSVFVGIFLIWLAYFTSEYTSYILGAFAFSFVLYLSILLLYFQRKKKFTISEKKEKYASSNIEEDEAEALVTKLTNVVTENKLYKNPNLTMPALAKKLHIRPQLLSQLLNDNLNKSFSNFINEYRIEEAKRMLSEDASLKIEVIAEQCGFNSNSAFYNAFKKVTNTTPAKYQNTKR